MRDKKVEVHVILDWEGVNCIQIIGAAEVHPEGHDLYMQIRDLVQEFDKAVQKRLRQERGEHNLEKRNKQ